MLSNPPNTLLLFQYSRNSQCYCPNKYTVEPGVYQLQAKLITGRSVQATYNAWDWAYKSRNTYLVIKCMQTICQFPNNLWMCTLIKNLETHLEKVSFKIRMKLVASRSHQKHIWYVLKASQNKKGQKKFHVTIFGVFFYSW